MFICNMEVINYLHLRFTCVCVYLRIYSLIKNNEDQKGQVGNLFIAVSYFYHSCRGRKGERWQSHSNTFLKYRWFHQ